MTDVGLHLDESDESPLAIDTLDSKKGSNTSGITFKSPLHEISPETLGIKCLDRYEVPYHHRLVQEGDRIPKTVKQNFTTYQDYASSVLIHILQGTSKEVK